MMKALLFACLLAGLTLGQQFNTPAAMLWISDSNSSVASPPYSVVVPPGDADRLLIIGGAGTATWTVYWSIGPPSVGSVIGCYGSVDLSLASPIVIGPSGVFHGSPGVPWIEFLIWHIPAGLAFDTTLQLLVVDPLDPSCGSHVSAAFHATHS